MLKPTALILAFMLVPISSSAQMVAGNDNAGADPNSIEGTWGGFAVCKQGCEGYAVFLNITPSKDGYRLKYKSFGYRSKWNRDYEVIALDDDRYLITPVEDRYISDAKVSDGRFVWSTRKNNCQHVYYRQEQLPDGISF